ncbi:hypothetical protein DBR32_14740 [Taibaiella sp. KBW10]|uniref:T9SS type A sorting domain-containing protein n=1 Tax=Taibaiella sp. KBW10 TaxID=2153357 RepID=UPI000F59990B|nr:T9SS type A sorting domain-containing protein [Taibaiella sp. KBW10]RQO29838.1 hypothetical protein DBR32_14740 [Taibaiella sp. KBW10]
MSHRLHNIKIILPILVWGMLSHSAIAQTSYRFGTSSGIGGAIGSGYEVANQKATFVNNATPAVFGTTNVTVSLSNQQYGNTTAHPFEGMVNPIYSGAVAFGAVGGTGNADPIANNRFTNLYAFGTPANNLFTIHKMAAPGTGINAPVTGAFTIALFTDALLNAAGDNINGMTDLDTDIQFADITLTFNEPVSNPVIHLGGLGGTADVTLPNAAYHSWLGFTPVFELLNAYSVMRLSGSAYFDVDPLVKKAKTSTTWLGFSSLSAGSCYGGKTTYGASGSFVVNAINISTLTLRIYLRSDEGRVTDAFNSIPCPTPANVIYHPFSATLYPRWSDLESVRSDAFALSVSFARSKVTGNVFNDPDGGHIDNSTGAANLVPGGIYANLIDTATGFVLKSVPVSTNGVFDFGELNANGYQVVLSSTLSTSGMAPAPYTAPTGWVNTGAFNGIPNTGNTGVCTGVSEIFEVNEAGNRININFGIQQLPESDNHNTTIPQPDTNDTLVLDGLGANLPLLSGSDIQDGTYTGAAGTVRNPSGVIITSLPVNGVLYYNGAPVTIGDTIINPALLTITLTGSGYTSLQFEYAYLDAAGFADPTPAVYTINWSLPLPVSLLYFQASKQSGSILLQWATASEQNSKGFEIERSSNGSVWNNIGFLFSLSADGNSNTKLSYSFKDAQPFPAMNYYRLKQIDFDGKYEYSAVRTIAFANETSINIYPNPVTDKIRIEGLIGGEIIYIANMWGQRVSTVKAGGHTCTIDISTLAAGSYIIHIIDASGIQISAKKLAKT